MEKERRSLNYCIWAHPLGSNTAQIFTTLLHDFLIGFPGLRDTISANFGNFEMKKNIIETSGLQYYLSIKKSIKQ